MISRFFAFSAMLFSTSVLADEPKALVIDVLGTTSPQVEAFEEIGAGTVIQLSGGSELTLSYYATCDEITFRNGTVTIENDRLLMDGGEIISRVAGDCPEQVALAAADVTNAAIITRAVINRPRVSLKPSVGIAGTDAGNFTTLRVQSAKGTIITLPVNGRRVVWPAEAPSLTSGMEYVFVLSGPDLQTRAAKVVADSDVTGLTVLRQ